MEDINGIRSNDIRYIDGKEFEVEHGMYLGKFIARVYLNGEVCFDMDGELDTDTENEYIKCWLNLEN